MGKNGRRVYSDYYLATENIKYYEEEQQIQSDKEDDPSVASLLHFL